MFGVFFIFPVKTSNWISNVLLSVVSSVSFNALRCNYFNLSLSLFK